MAVDTPTLEAPAARAVGAYLREQLGELEAREPQVRRDQPDAVHKMRVAIRRLRSALATYRPLLDRDVSGSLRDELRWLAGVLGEVRDPEVMHERVAAVLADPDGPGPGETGTRLLRHLEEARRSSQVRVVETLDGDRYASLVDDLEAFVAGPPWTEPARRPAGEVLPERVRSTWRRLRRRVRAVESAQDPAQRAARMHEVRKAAKRARYAAESLVPLYGDPAGALARELTSLQDVLGAHQDSVIAERLARDLGHEHLEAVERLRQTEYQAQYTEVWRRVSRRRLRRWLRT